MKTIKRSMIFTFTNTVWQPIAFVLHKNKLKRSMPFFLILKINTELEILPSKFFLLWFYHKKLQMYKKPKYSN